MNGIGVPNPFKPTAGMNPPELIGRDEILEDFVESLDNGPGAPDRLMRISGVRGVGKTVLLNALGDVARSHSFVVVDVVANEHLCERIIASLKRHAKVSSATIAPSVLGVSLGSVEVSTSPLELGDSMLAATKKGGLLVTVDEIQDAPIEQMRVLGNEIQLLIRKGANVAFAFAGLPTAIDSVVSAESLTFLQRARHVELTRLDDFEVGSSIEDTVEGRGKRVSPAVAATLTKAAAGYPFMVQLVGYYAWQRASRRGSNEISEEDASAGVALARKSFDSMVIAPALKYLPQKQLEYLRGMAACEHVPAQTGEVAEHMGLQASATSSYRKRLMEAGLIEAVGYGKVDFAIPYMRDYLREHAEELL